MLAAFIYGFIFALGLIIPLGAQNIFVFNQGASQKHFYQALPVILTASLCDTLLIVLAVSGVSLIVLKMEWLKIVIYVVGLTFLLYMARSIWRTKAPTVDTIAKPLSTKKQVLFAVSVSLLNPHAIIDTVAVIGTNSLNFSGNARIAYTVACIFVSFIWFFFLAIMGKTIHRLNTSGSLINAINKVSAVILLWVACYIAYQLYLQL
jgi:L-lysine exporter family protein LysE/ArgO